MKPNLLNTVLLIGALIACPAGVVGASDSKPVKLTRYTTLNSGIATAQADILTGLTSFQFNNVISTVGQAINSVLIGSGFRLASASASDPYLPVLLNAPLPDVHRSLGPASVSDILGVLAGPTWTLVTDPVNRLITFDLKQQYWPCNYDKGAFVACE